MLTPSQIEALAGFNAPSRCRVLGPSIGLERIWASGVAPALLGAYSSSLGLPPLSSLGTRSRARWTLRQASTTTSVPSRRLAANSHLLCQAWLGRWHFLWRPTSMDFLEASLPLLAMHPSGAADAASAPCYVVSSSRMPDGTCL